jgi:adenosylhomocysteine nucleosidase
MEPPKRIAVFVATPWEMDAVRAAFPTGVERRVNGVRVRVCAVGSREYWLTRTGVGLQKASGVASRLLTYQPFCLAVSTGFACALIAAEVGALLAGGDVIFNGVQGSTRLHTLDVPGPERNAVLALVSGSDSSAHVGLFVSADHIVGRASEKQRIARVTGAIGLDMESAALATEARRTRVPFVIVRAASDLLDEDLPLDFNLFLRPTGWLKGVALALSSPASLRSLSRLRQQSVVAGRNLTAFFHRYVRVMATADAGARTRPEIP